jgi:dTDP-glucose 4,6-dehydratase
MTQTILVTGGAGFIGSNFVHYLFNRFPEYKIKVLDALTYAGDVANLPVGGFEGGRMEFVYGDVRNGELVNALVAESNMVVHFAAESHVTRSIYDNRLFFETDVLGTQTVASAVTRYADRIDRYIHISTSEVYGSAISEKMDEQHPLDPRSPYAAAKCGADRLVYSYWATYGIPAVIVRPFNNFGPRQHLEKLIPRFITSCLLGEPLTVHGDGEAARDFIFVEDHCEALVALMKAPREKVIGEVFNIGTGIHRSINEIATSVRKAMGVDPGEERIGDRPGQVFRHTCDGAKLERVVGFKPRTSFEEGMARTVAWYRANENWWRAQMWMRHIPIILPSGKKELH